MNIDVVYIPNVEGLIKNSLVSATSYPNAAGSSAQNLVFGLTRWNNLNAGPYWPGYQNSARTCQGGDNLNIRAQPSDKIRLRTASSTLGFRYQCFIQSIAFYEHSITATTHQCEAITSSTQDSTGSATPSSTVDDYWELTVGEKTGVEQCTINFAVFDSNATRVGGFSTYLYVNWPGESPYSIC